MTISIIDVLGIDYFLPEIKLGAEFIPFLSALFFTMNYLRRMENVCGKSKDISA